MTAPTQGLNLHLRLDQITAIAEAGPTAPDDVVASAGGGASSNIVVPISLYSVPSTVEDGPVPTLPDVGTAPPIPPQPTPTPTPTPTAPASVPSVVPDEIFGGSLLFDGVNDAGIALDPANIPTGDALTLALWADAATGPPRNSAIFEALDAGGHRTVNIHLPWGDGVIYFDCGNDGADYDRLSKAATPDEYSGGWAHWAFVKDVHTQSMLIYRNGLVWASTTGPNRPIQPSTAAVLGASLDDPVNGRWAGRIANLRIYDHVLTGDEIRGVMAEDQAAQATFRQSYPVDIGLYDDADDQPVLTATNDTAGRTLRVEVTNSADRTFQLLPVAGVDGQVLPTADTSHLTLRFRPGTLAPTFLAAAGTSLKSLAQGWAGAAATEPDGVQAIYLLCTATPLPSLTPGQQLSIRLPGVAADGTGGARGTRVEARYGNLTWSGDDATPVAGSRSVHLEVVTNYGGTGVYAGATADPRRLPLHFGFVGSRTVRSDGTTPNTLTLEIGNTRLSDSLALTPVTGVAPTRFLLTFDASPGAGAFARNWALGTADQLQAITPSVSPEPGRWSVVQESAESPQWVVSPATDITLAPGESFLVTLAPIVTALAEGETNLYITYQNLPGYPDGTVVLTLEKSLGTAAIDISRAQTTMTGGGEVRWTRGVNVGHFSWTRRFVATGSQTVFRQGYVEVRMPAVGEHVEWLKVNYKTVSAQGIALQEYESLYAIVPPDLDPPGAVKLTIINPVISADPAATEVPGNYLLLATVNPDDHSLRLGTGVTLPGTPEPGTPGTW